MADQYLRVVEILAIHHILIDEFGGVDGIRDLGALEAAVFRPQTGYYDDPIAEAAALMESLIQNHPFLDGNKRTAVAAADVHLRMHGLELAGDSTEHHRVIIGLMDARSLELKSLDEWLRANVEGTTRRQRRQRIGRDQRTTLGEEETDWLDS